MAGYANNQIDYADVDKKRARDRLIIEYLPQVKRIVQRIAAHLPTGIETDDLIHAGIIGLIQSAERYDPTRKNHFMSYAQIRIRGAVLSELRARDFLSRPIRKRLRELEDAYFRLEQKSNGEVNEEDVAGEMGISLEEVHHIRQRAGISFIRLEDMNMVYQKERAAILKEISEVDVGDAFDRTQFKEIIHFLSQEIDRLPEKERMVISLYYTDELTMKEIGKVLDITESRVSQIHSTAVMRLRRQMRKQGYLGE